MKYMLLAFTGFFLNHTLFAQQALLPDTSGQPAIHTIQEVDITTLSGHKKPLLYQPASIARIGARELKRGNGLFLLDVVNGNIPGVLMESRSVSGGQQFNIRGFGNGVGSRDASNNFDGEGEKVYLNGIPITDAEGITLLDDIDFGSVGSMEVLKGPSGTLYGLAIAGVVNLSTLQPEVGEVSIGQDVLLGSYGLQRYTTHVHIGGKRSSLLVNYGRQLSNGYLDTHSASRKDFVSLVATARMSDRESMNAYFGYSKSYDERAGELTIGQYEAGDYSGNPDYIQNDAHSAITGFRAGLGHTYDFNRHISNTTTVFASGISNHSSSAAGWTDKAPVSYGLRSTVNILYDLGRDIRISSIAGVESQAQYAAIQSYAMIPDSMHPGGYNRIGGMKSNQETFSSTTSLFTEWTVSMPHDYSLTAGLGWSTLFINLQDRLYVPGSRKQTGYAVNYNRMFSPHLALNKVFNRQVSVYLAYSKGYRAPVSGNIFIPAANKVNKGLKPEKGNQWEIGTKGDVWQHRLHYEAAAYYTRFSDKMTVIAVPLNAATTAYTYVANGGSQDDKGIELSATCHAYHAPDGFFRSIDPFANFCYAHFRYAGYQFQTLDKDKKPAVADYDGKAVAGVPPLTFNAGADWTMQWGLYAGISYNHRDGMPITSDGAHRTAGYNLLNARLGIRQAIGKHFDLDVYFGADNLTGTRYYYMVFLNQLPDAYLPAPEKTSFYGGLGLSFRL